MRRLGGAVASFSGRKDLPRYPAALISRSKVMNNMKNPDQVVIHDLRSCVHARGYDCYGYS